MSFSKVFQELTGSGAVSPWTAWSDFITMYACAISNAVDKSHYEEREALYLKTASKYSAAELELFSKLCAEVVITLEENPGQDFLGSVYQELGLGNYHSGQFFTPYSVCEAMAKMTLGEAASLISEKGYISIGDPACGAGATLIAGIHEIERLLAGHANWQDHILIKGQDIDWTVGLMCYIQISLLGAAGFIKIGNSLTKPMTTADTTENYWFTPMYFSDVWMVRRIIKGQWLL